MDDLRAAFEKLHLGGNPQLARRNTTDGSYVLPSINDAWGGFQSGYAAGMERLIKEQK